VGGSVPETAATVTIETILPAARHRAETWAGQIAAFAGRVEPLGRRMMAAINRKKGRLRLVLLIAVALGAFSALLSGSLAALAEGQVPQIFYMN
jgi:hypothetical protein